jgi:signal transduction histidine kinase
MAEAIEMGQAETAGCLCYSKVHCTKSIHPTCPHAQLLRDGKKHTVEIFEERLGGHYEVTAVPYYGEDGTTLLGSVHISRNINERKMMELERDRMQVKFLHAQKLESVGRLASGIAHEINTPIQFVSSNNDFLEESFQELKELLDGYEALFQSMKKGELNAALVEKAESLREDVDWEYLAEEIPTALKQTKEGLTRVATIVRAMKEFSHPGSKEKELRNLNDIAKTTGIVARNEWKYVAELKMNLAEDLPNVMCFSDDIGQVFLNIIINAAHAIEDKLGRNPEGQKGIIALASKDGDGHVEVSISDTGIGMAKEMQRKVFDPFYTTKKVGRGTGQGLAIAWNIIVEKHGGELKVESEAGAGTTFIIRLPKR